MVTASERSLTPCFGTVIEQVRERDRANLESRFALLEVCLSSLLFFFGAGVLSKEDSTGSGSALSHLDHASALPALLTQIRAFVSATIGPTSSGRFLEKPKRP